MLSIRTLQKKKLLYTEESFGSPRPILTSSNEDDGSGDRIRRGLQTDGVWLFGSLTRVLGLLAVRALTKA